MKGDNAVQPDSHAYVTLLKTCAKLKDLERARHLCAEVALKGLQGDLFVGSALVSMLGKCGSLAEAHEAFNQLPARNEVSWNALISGYAEWGLGQEALNCFEQMQANGLTPNAVTFVSSLKACSSIRSVERGRKIYTKIAKLGLDANKFVGNTLVDMFSKCGSLAEAQEVFDKQLVRDAVSWNALIAGYSDCGSSDESLRCFQQMQIEGIFPDAVTFVCTLKACGTLRDIERGRLIGAQVARQGLETNVFIGSTLVDMFSKCGLVVEAEQAFNRMAVRNVVSWNALIAGYVELGFDGEALNCFEKMQLEGVFPNAASFVCSLKACGSLGALEKGRQLWAGIAENKLEKDSFVSSAAVDMFVKCGSLAEAQELFDVLPVRDAVSWSALIAGYAEHGLCVKVLNCLEQMSLEGVSPVPVTCMCSLKACSTLSATKKGEEIYTEIVSKGFERDLLVGNVLVDMFGKSGYLVEAQQVFQSLQVKDVVSWSALIKGYAEHGLDKEVFHCYEQMQLGGVLPDAVTYLSSLKACCMAGSLERGRAIYSDILQQGLEEDCLVNNSVIDMFSKCGSLTDAQNVFDMLPVRDVVSWSVLITGYADHGSAEEAYRCFQQMQLKGVSPDAIAFTCSLKACGALEAIETGRLIHVHISYLGLERDLFVVNALIDMYLKCGSFAESQAVFDKLLNRDVVSWNILIAGYAENELGMEALKCFEEMQLHGVSPSPVTFVCTLEACANAGAIEQGQKIYMEIARKGLEKDHIISSSLVDMFAKCGSIVEAESVFDKLPAHDLISWSALITGYTEHGLGEEALKRFGQMKVDVASPDAAIFVSCLKACCSIGSTETSMHMHTEITKHGLESHTYVGSMLVDMYCKCGSLEDAQAVFNMLPERDTASWSAIIKGFGTYHKGNLALHFFQDMQEQGVKPDAIAFTCLLVACSHVSLVFKGQHYFQMMREAVEVEPLTEQCASMVDLLARSGHVYEAEKFIETMQCPPSREVWTALLNGCKVYGEVELGLKCFQQLVEMSLEDASAYVLMASIYASAGKWDDALRLEELRKSSGTRKKLASSSIEINKRIYQFVVGHHQHKNLLEIIDELTLDIKHHSYVPDLDVISIHALEELDIF